MRIFSALLAGLIFGIGLALSGMVDPARVIGFLDIAGGQWDPTLAFVLAGAVGVAALGFALTGRRQAPVLEASFEVPPVGAIGVRMLGGAVLFGVGWGLVGYCPGPAIASLGFAGQAAAMFTLAMVGAMVMTRWILEAAAMPSNVTTDSTD